MEHRTETFRDWATFSDWLSQMSTDGWQLICFQVVPADSRAAGNGKMTVYAVISRQMFKPQ